METLALNSLFGDSLVQKHSPIQRIPLHRLEPSVANNPPQFFLCGAVGSACGFDHILFKHDAAYIVAAEVEAEFEHLEALRDP
jgi:hypothetical protein